MNTLVSVRNVLISLAVCVMSVGAQMGMPAQNYALLGVIDSCTLTSGEKASAGYVTGPWYSLLLYTWKTET